MVKFNKVNFFFSLGFKLKMDIVVLYVLKVSLKVEGMYYN